MLAMVFLLVISISAAIFEKSHFKNEIPAIVFAEMVEVKSEPQKLASNVVTLHEGTKVYVKETLKNWKKIQLTDGTDGWIETSTIKEVK